MEKIDTVYLSLHELSALLKSGRLSSQELVKNTYDRINQINPKVNAVISLLPFAQAMALAKERDKSLTKDSSPLHGIPMTVKDGLLVKGLPCSNGDPRYFKRIAKEDAFLVKKLKEAGAILIGKTNLPHFCLDWQSVNLWAGRTKNPFDLARTPGGSSGGSAAALASGMVSAEVGSDAGGSIRVPAHYCGVYGLRPSEGVLRSEGSFSFPNSPKAFDRITVNGPMARSMQDIEILFDALFDQEHFSKSVAPLELSSFSVNSEKAALAFSLDFAKAPLDREYEKILRSFVKNLSKKGHTVNEDSPKLDIEQAKQAWATLTGFDFGVFSPKVGMARWLFKTYLLLKHKDRQWIQSMYLGMKRYPNKEIQKAMNIREEATIEINSFLDRYDAWLTPVDMDAAFLTKRSGSPHLINGEKVSYTAIGNFTFTTALSGHPICVIPIGKKSNGLPVGIQVHARKFADIKLIKLCKSLSQGCEFSPPRSF